MRTNIYLILIYLVIISSSANKDLKTIKAGLEGNWTFDSMSLGENHSLTVMSNILTFKKNGEFLFPGTDNISWKVKFDSLYIIQIKFSSEIQEFNNTFIIQFRKDRTDKLLKLYMTSDMLKLNCSKMLFNYDKNTDEIEKLIKLTNR